MTKEVKNARKGYKVWTCKVVVDAGTTLPSGFDAPPRSAVEKAIADAGIELLCVMSGWGASLTSHERKTIEELQRQRSLDALDPRDRFFFERGEDAGKDEVEFDTKWLNDNAPFRGPDINVANLEAAMAKVMEERDTLLRNKSTLEGYVEEIVNSGVNPSSIIDALCPPSIDAFCKWTLCHESLVRYTTSCGLSRAERYEGANFCERCGRRIAVKVL